MKQVEVVAGAIFNSSGKVLIARRKAGKSLAGKWEFPGGKIEVNEEPTQALHRELLEELHAEVDVQDFIMTNKHDYPSFRILLHLFRCSIRGRINGSDDHDKLEWVDPSELSGFDLAEADVPFIEVLKKSAF